MRKLPLAILFCLSALCLNGMADTITLKDGTVYNGDIVQQDDTQITVNYKQSESISDTKVIQRADIAKIEKPAEDAATYDQIKAWKPNPWAMLSVDAYKSTIAALNDFLQKYPQSTHKAEVQEMLHTFQDEQAHQQAGDVKLYGVWIPSKVAADRSLQVEAQTIYLKIQSSIDHQDYIGALNLFDQLEKSYANTRAYPAAIERISPVLTQLQIEINRDEENLKITDAKWQEGVTISPEPQKSQIVAARQAELKHYDDILAAAQTGGAKWPPFMPQSQKSMDAVLALVTAEKAALQALTVDKMNASIKESDKAGDLISASESDVANTALATKDLDAADTLLKNALVLWPTNEEATYLQKIITDIRAARAHPEAGTKVPVFALRSTPKAAGAVPTPKPAPVATPAETPAPEEPPAKPSLVDFFFTIPGALTVVACAVGLIAIASFLQRRKKDQEED